MTEQNPIWRAPGVEPPEELKNSGWSAGMKPSAEHMNWLLTQLAEAAASAGVTVEDLLTSDSAINALSAKQGKVLDTKLTNLKDQFTSHLAQSDGLIKHAADQISFTPPTGMLATNMQDGLVEAFLLGNSRKEDLVDKLLLLDNRLPINYNSTWTEVINAITMVTTGKKWSSGAIVSSGDYTAYFADGSTSTTLRGVAVSLSFKPSTILAFGYGGMYYNSVYYDARDTLLGYPTTKLSLYSGASLNQTSYNIRVQGSYHVTQWGFLLPVLNHGTYQYIAVE